MRNYEKYKDNELLALIRESGKPAEKAFNVLYSRYSERTYGYCIYRSGNIEEAQELMQESWIKFFRSVENGKTPGKVLPYIFTITRNLSIDRHRSKKATKSPDLRYLDEETLENIADPFDFEKDIENEEFRKLVKIAINNLDDIYKDTIALYWFGDMSYSEIAEIIEETEACVRTRIKRAFEKLAAMMKPYLTNIHKEE